MLKKASDTRASSGQNRVIATLVRVGRLTLVVLVMCASLLLDSFISHAARPFATSAAWP